MHINDLVEKLPEHLGERIRIVGQSTVRAEGQFILYWMCTAIRDTENPALDAACEIATQLGKPLLVYQGLSSQYEYASDRFHTFILEGARDVQKSLAERGISYAFHLERPADTRDHLRHLAQRACAVVTEDMPTHAPRLFLKALARSVETPVVATDTACVVSPRLVGKAYDRAFAYRSKTKRLCAERLTRSWPECTSEPTPFELSELPFETPNLQEASIPDLVAECDIDHSIGPVLDTRGGSASGNQRWNTFVDKGLKSYAKRRNNALLDGVSRMSAYLHFGMVSPMRLAREAADLKHDGAEKYLDELLIWRELAYCFCHFEPKHDRWSALPNWAQETLQQHASDRRDATYSWEELSRGETGDALWNAAQKSLLLHGELHNNVRMTWGKAILQWRDCPKDALRTIIDLNHRYALDGRDPASYGGILWCLGQFDRPFQPETHILGTVRPRPTDYHAQRLAPEKYAARTSVPRCSPVPEIAVIGAGLSGSFAARTLIDQGLPVTVFEKSRGAGGRMATRRSEVGDFDHGAQYFTARDPRFRRYVDAWLERGLVARWESKIVSFDEPGVSNTVSNQGASERFVAVPKMNQLGKHLSHNLDVRTETEIQRVDRADGRIEIFDVDDQSLGQFDHVIVTAPAPQSAHLLRSFPELASKIETVRMNPCWCVMMMLDEPLGCEWGGAFVNTGPLAWIARNSTKPGRDTHSERITLHANPDWSRDHLEDAPEQVAATLSDAFWRTFDHPPQPARFIQVHRWRYSIPGNPTERRCLATDDRRLIACGDWAGGPRVEGAFLSGSAAAGLVVGSLKYEQPMPVGQLDLF
ncbi:MAG: FAD-dependent oxidoreductase [Planctomycetota bacterium]